MQIFWRPHIHKLKRSSARRRLSLSEMLGVYDLEKLNLGSVENRQLPFESAPISHWVHLFAPPPGPHAPLILVRFIFPDRCLAIDAQGIFHFFRWAWRSDPEVEDEQRPFRVSDLFSDRGHFVAQRELPHFRSVPRLHLSRPKPSNWRNSDTFAVTAISKCLFAGRALLVVSDGDRKGGLCLQLVDPSKCVVQGEVFVKSAHSSRITAIGMDPIGTGKKYLLIKCILRTLIILYLTFLTLLLFETNSCWSWRRRWRIDNCWKPRRYCESMAIHHRPLLSIFNSTPSAFRGS